MAYVDGRIDDALTLWRAGWREGAFLLAIVASTSSARPISALSLTGSSVRRRSPPASRYQP